MNGALWMAGGKEQAEQTETATNVENLSALWKILSHLFEEAEAEDLKAAPAIRANNG